MTPRKWKCSFQFPLPQPPSDVCDFLRRRDTNEKAVQKQSNCTCFHVIPLPFGRTTTHKFIPIPVGDTPFIDCREMDKRRQ
jgi:hypothetical protein